ncbi:MAG TPA: hypothetical protein DEG17_18590 [Cyanobacteria bacterium UBA11149]|nr:hypothetical protein [Cyanobacteria bacterium UBA11367]HBE60113.1 hypothetical protein [Cyanobacteria bacterium UBA11366]HBK62689.1 hypothetical protein [Cyanobacteria bacterium UBA11166]HBR72546.1 hypothetical protein [Cyanobacteria bacterium UBA11159]HBS71643.1 hypothetical protein [Cyanobacteria bacterium UBA11153]HBW90819.1 hypothetical protein [Cyanobacteria bacterium UBA11149]HCA97728.1 hypothetical protein [Cyanobacteria bacterium UBA9226]
MDTHIDKVRVNDMGDMINQAISYPEGRGLVKSYREDMGLIKPYHIVKTGRSIRIVKFGWKI